MVFRSATPSAFPAYPFNKMARSTQPHTDRDLLGKISRSAGQKAGYKQLVRELGLGGGRERRLLLEQLSGMVTRGDLVRLREGMWGLPPKNPDSEVPKREFTRPESRFEGMEAVVRSGRDRLISGRLDLHRDGFGFVRPDANSAGSRTLEDIFIPPNEIHGAMQGDVVLVDEAPVGRDGRRSGRIARVLTRRNPTVVGIFHYAASGRRREWGGQVSGNYVTPLDERVASVIAIPDGGEVVAVVAVTLRTAPWATRPGRRRRGSRGTCGIRWRVWLSMSRSRTFRALAGRREGE